MKPLLLCVLLLASVATADESIRLHPICKDGELVGLHIFSATPFEGTIPLPAGICSQGDA